MSKMLFDKYSFNFWMDQDKSILYTDIQIQVPRTHCTGIKSTINTFISDVQDISSDPKRWFQVQEALYLYLSSSNLDWLLMNDRV